jgi:hypothetical protein
MFDPMGFATIETQMGDLASRQRARLATRGGSRRRTLRSEISSLRPVVNDPKVRFFKPAGNPIRVTTRFPGDADSVEEAVGAMVEAEFPLEVELHDPSYVFVASMSFDAHLSESEKR